MTAYCLRIRGWSVKRLIWQSASEDLTRAARVTVIETLTQRLLERSDVDAFLGLSDRVLQGDFDWSVKRESFTVFLTHFVEEASRRAMRVTQAAQRITEDPAILGGTPCFAGTRAPVANVLAAKQQGMTLDELQSAWPFVTAQLLDDAKVYMKAHPRPGRPRRLGKMNPQLRQVSRKIVHPAQGHA